MHTISTAALLSIVALASSLAFVVQAKATKNHNHMKPGCTDPQEAMAGSCLAWQVHFSQPISPTELIGRVLKYNVDVNKDCTNLTIGDTVRVFLL